MNDPADIQADPHISARSFVHSPIPGDPLAVVGNPISFRGEALDEPLAPSRWPTLGQDTERILSERLGLGADEISTLRQAGDIA